MSLLILVDSRVNHFIHSCVQQYYSPFITGTSSSYQSFKSNWEMGLFPCMFKYFIQEKGRFSIDYKVHTHNPVAIITFGYPMNKSKLLSMWAVYDFFNDFVE